MSNLSVEHLLGIKYLKNSDIELIFETANHFKEVINRPIKKFLPCEISPLPICFLRIVPVPNYHLNWPKKDFLRMLSISQQVNLQ